MKIVFAPFLKTSPPHCFCTNLHKPHRGARVNTVYSGGAGGWGGEAVVRDWAAGTWKVKVKVTQSCPTLCDPTKRLTPDLLHCRQIFYQLSHRGSPRILEWYPFSRGSSRHRNQTRVSCVTGGFFASWGTREAWGYPSKRHCVHPSGLDHSLFCPGLLSKGPANIQVLSCYRLSQRFTASCEDRLHTLLKRTQAATRTLF